MPVVSYTFLRGLELEGRHPHDVGAWNLTVRRMGVGEGVPQSLDWAESVEFQEGEPYPPAPKLPPSKRVHFFYYRRVRSSAECERYLRSVGSELAICVDLFPQWADPLNGVIPMPVEGDLRLDTTHLVVLDHCWPERREFHFRNTWGEAWGDRGHGVLPYEYVDRYVFESWVSYLEVRPEKDQFAPAEGRRDRRWVVRDEWDRRVYGFEVWDEAGQERCAWAFVLEKDGALEVEELYVRPEFRRRGYAKILAGKIRGLVGAKHLPLRLWVAFADSRQEDPSNYPALVVVARLLGVQFQPCPAIWAAYFATDERAGSDVPIEPSRIPPRPNSALEAVLGLALALSPAHASNGVSQPAVAAESAEADFPEPGTKAWGVMNRRRGELIHKDIRGELAPEEQIEYERLQRLSQIAIERAFPAPTRVDEQLARVEARLRIIRGENTE